MSFGNWPSELHYDYKQVQRILSAQAKSMERDVLEIDPEKKVIVVKGSADDPYIATLDECTCPDFMFRRKPCKHMYKLAIELNLLNEIPERDDGVSSYDPEKEIEKYRELYIGGKIPGEAYVPICKALEKLIKQH